jgi:hypothetical protein
LESTIRKYQTIHEKLLLLEKHFGTDIETEDNASSKKAALRHLQSVLKAKLQRSEQKRISSKTYHSNKSDELSELLSRLESDIEKTTYPTFGGSWWVRKEEDVVPKSPRRRPRPPSPDVKDWSTQNSEELECLVCGIAGWHCRVNKRFPHTASFAERLAKENFILKNTNIYKLNRVTQRHFFL